MIKTKIKPLLALLCVGVLLCGLFSGCAEQTFSRTEYMMDTAVTMELRKGGSEELLDGAFALAESLSKELDCYGFGELAQLNENGGGEVGEYLLEAVTLALQYCELSGGALDITLRPVTKLWDFKAEQPALPNATELMLALARVGYYNVTVDGNKMDLGGTELDLGGVAKGYICKKVQQYLVQCGVKSAILDFGGNICCIGGKSGGSFLIGVADPQGGDPVYTVSVKDKSVVTSGIYQRYFMLDGVRYHHIINPATGYPMDGNLASVSIICADPAEADCLSTAVLVLGAEVGRALVESLDGVDAIFVFVDGTVQTTF